MKKSKLISAKELLSSKSKTPWACFETCGIVSEDGTKGVPIGMYWNDAFIKDLAKVGIQGQNDQETMQLFFLYMASQVANAVSEEIGDVVNPEATPNLSSDANSFVS
jgi:hypothetical protein